MLNNNSIKELFTKYQDGTATLTEMKECLEYNIALCTETMASLNEPATSTLWDISNSKSQSKQVLAQLSVKLQEFYNNIETVTEYDSDLEQLFKDWQACQFNVQMNCNDNMTMPNFLDVNLWIRKGELMTPLNDMIWRPTKRYDEGDIVMCFLDGIFYANIDYNGTNTNWSYKSKGYNQYQGIDLRPVYFICKKGCINEHPFNNNMGKCLVRNSINYYAVEITSIIKLNNYYAFNTKWFNNKTYWEPITNLHVFMSTTLNACNVPAGNIMCSDLQNIPSITLSIMPYCSLGWGSTANVNNSNDSTYYGYIYGIGCFRAIYNAQGYSTWNVTFPNFKTTTETTFDAAYAKWTK